MKKLFQIVYQSFANNIRTDWVMHFITCTLLVLNCLMPLWYAIMLAVILSVCKELYDKYIKKTLFDWTDIYADLLGIALGILLRIVSPLIVQLC